MIKHRITLALTVESDHDDSEVVADEIMGSIQKTLLMPGEDVELIQAEIVDH